MQYYQYPDLGTYSVINGVSNVVPAGFTVEWMEIASGVLSVFGALDYTKIDSGARINVGSSGVVNFGVVKAGATLDVQGGGQVGYWDVYGSALIENGAIANYMTIEQGVTSELGVGATGNFFDVYGREIVDASATANFMTIEQGATAEALSGAQIIGAQVSGGLTVDAGATAENVTVESGGVVTLNAGATASGFSFDAASPGGRIIVKSGASSNYTVSGLDYGDAIDFAGVAYRPHGSVAYSSLGSFGFIKLTEGGVVETLTVTNSIANPNFVVKSDGAGGSLLVVQTDYVAPTPAHANDISHSGDVTGAYNMLDPLNLEASYSDLIGAFGNNAQAMQNWVANNQGNEKRPDSFDGLDYVASYSDLIAAFQGAGSQTAVLDAGASHYIGNGVHEGRSVSFNGLDYIASYGDLIKAFGANGDAGAYHYIESGYAEGRSVSFDGLDYIASYQDLIHAFGVNEQAGAEHYIQNGFGEGRATSFDGLDYIAGYTDLMSAFGANGDSGAQHYIENGNGEGRNAHPFNVAAYESAHPDLIRQFASDDAFLTAYINNYAANKTFLT